MIDANEAREIGKESEILDIYNRIEKSAKSGEFKIVINKHIKPTTSKILNDLGYEVKLYLGHNNEKLTRIEWW